MGDEVESRLSSEIEQALLAIIDDYDQKAIAKSVVDVARLARIYHDALLAVGFDRETVYRLLFDWHLQIWGTATQR